MGDMAMAIFDIQSVDWIEWMSFPPEEHKLYKLYIIQCSFLWQHSCIC